MMRTLRDMNMSKFVAEDVPLFLSLIDDLFPGQNADRASFPDVSAALAKVSLPDTILISTLGSRRALACRRRLKVLPCKLWY